jgi:hypothetical protein
MSCLKERAGLRWGNGYLCISIHPHHHSEPMQAAVVRCNQHRLPSEQEHRSGTHHEQRSL